ncbi:glycine betaine ABC transporter substrate-binding protein [Streptomyces sp. NPDC047002]|uniref:glycine betaine ABC transporter substrate-binding protein n=1 Tax=Streptomyces sp. NPDC047002 TaxID=3155475 RepID=UPI003456C563
MKRTPLLACALAALAAATLTACGSGPGSGGGGDSVAGGMILGAAPEFKTRTDGLTGLKKVYGVAFDTFKPLDAGGPLTVNALKNGQIDAGNVFTTDPSIKTDHFVVLKDPGHLFLAQNVVPLAAKKKVTPGAAEVLDAVSAKLTTDALVELNEEVVGEKKDPDAVAEKWLAANGLAAHGTRAAGARLTVGSANFQESVLLAHLYADALTAQGATVAKKLNIGSRETYIPGLQQGSIDLVPEYTGVLLQYFDKSAHAETSDAVYTALKKAAPAALTVLAQSSAQDTDAIVVTSATAKKYHLTSIADLAKKP